jgi:RNA-directed DNA polymerase
MLSVEELKECLVFAKDYREIKIPKKNGGYRTILIPSPELKRIQGKILRFLKKMYILRDSSVFGLRNGSYVDHARFHSDSRWIFAFDLKDAFPSVSIERVRPFLIQALREKMFSLNQVWPMGKAEELASLISELTTFKGTLPQGAPTSPFLFFLAIEETKLVTKLFYASRPLKISCYVDGFVISGPHPPNAKIKEKIFRCIEGAGFEANLKKTRQFDCRQGTPLICGLRVDGEGKISLPKKTIRKWRGLIHQAAYISDPDIKKRLAQKIRGFIGALKPIYGDKLPPQIAKPYDLFVNSLKELPGEKQTRLTNWM